LSSQKAKGNLELFGRTFFSSLSQILYFSFPAMAVTLILRIPLVRLAYGSKTFPWEATILTGKVVALISLAIFSQSATQILVRGFYSVRNTKTPLVIGLFCVVTNIFFSLFLGFKLSWGIVGLAAATSFSSFLEAILLLFFFRKVVAQVFTRETFKKWLKMIFATLISSFFFWSTMKLLDLFVFNTSRTIYVLILTLVSSSVGFLSYFFLTKKMGLEEADNFLSMIKKISQAGKTFSPPEEIIDGSSSG